MFLFACLAAFSRPAQPAYATTQLTVDLSRSYRPVTHVGIGALYGVTENVPADADLQRLVGALHPKMFTNPASSDPGTQQPGIPANAIKVAARLAPFGGTVTIRLADWFSGFYSFTDMDDWFSKMSATVSAKQAAKVANVYAYEIWNEPNGTFGDRTAQAFNDFWRQSYVKLRQLDPGAKITGPSISWYDEGFMRPFLTYCKSNNCLPDIVGWHEGTGINIEGDVQRYRSLEKELGIGPLPITMNEYSGAGWAKDEGRPGASAPLIAQLERAGVETACASWWLPESVAGHLGSLLATDTQPNGGWYLYKWYGNMSGDMVAATSSLSKDGKNLDGFASLDAAAGNAFVILGGINDGSVDVIVKGFTSARFFGESVHTVVERTSWTGRSSVVAGTQTLAVGDVAIASDQITIPINNLNADDGYRVSLTRVGAGTGGALGTGGRSASGGDAAADAGTSTLDANATGGAAGKPGAGGNTGGHDGLGGASGTGGVKGTGGALAAGGASVATGGARATGGASDTGGLADGGAVAGRTGTADEGSSGGIESRVGGSVHSSSPGGTAGTSGPSKSSGCSCQIPRPSRKLPAPSVLLPLSALAYGIRKLRRRQTATRNRIHPLGNRHLVPPVIARGQACLPRQGEFTS